MGTKINAVTLSYVKAIPIEYILKIYIHINNLFSQLKSGTDSCRGISQI